MNGTLIGGLLTGLALVVLCVMWSGSAIAFFSIPALVIIIGGSSASTLLTYRWTEVVHAWQSLRGIVTRTVLMPADLIAQFVVFAETMRRDGIGALADEARRMPDSCIKKGLELVVSGCAPEQLRVVLLCDAAEREQINRSSRELYESVASYTIVYGIVGTIVGIIAMVRMLADPVHIGPGMAAALMATLYGALSAHLVFLPIAGKLKHRTERESLLNDMVIEGIVCIQRADEPRVVEEKLHAFLAPRLRDLVSRH